MLDHAIWQRLLRQAGPQSAHDVVWLDERWQPPVVRPLDDAFLAAHERLLRALHDELIAVGGSPPAPLGGIVADQETELADDRLETDERARTVDTVDWAALLARSLALQSQAQHLLRRSAQTVQDALQAGRRACPCYEPSSQLGFGMICTRWAIDGVYDGVSPSRQPPWGSAAARERALGWYVARPRPGDG